MSLSTAPGVGLEANGARVDIGHDPRTGVAHEGVPHSSDAHVEQVLAAAWAAAPAVAAASPQTRVRWLAAIGEALESCVDELAELADSETGLGSPRLPTELRRAAAQARFYGEVAVEGGVFDATIDPAAGFPPVDLRRVRLPLGPVAVFGASNFPFGFGVVGHDTCSAIAAGCPVVVKAHPAHPRLSVRLGEIVAQALRGAGAPDGTFGIVVGFDCGLALVDDSRIAAVGFTGSQRGGMALVDRAAARGRDGGSALPMPVYAEMGTVNPAVVTRAGVEGRRDQIVAGFVDSMTLGSGQFCTKPGLLLVPAGSGLAEAVVAELRARPAPVALTRGIAEAYRAGLADLQSAGGRLVSASTGDADHAANVDGVDESGDATQAFTVPPAVLVADVADMQSGSRLLEECFGPAALVVEYADEEERDDILRRLQPSLAAAVASGGQDDPETADIVAVLAHQVGRVVVDGWPTGVAGTWAQQHGGPWPATSRPEASSVGAAALERWLRPVAFQNVPDAALPPALQEANPWRLPRRVGGAVVGAPGVPTEGMAP